MFGVLGEEKKLLLLKRPGEKFPRERDRRKGANDEGRENEYTNFLGRILKDDVASGKKSFQKGSFRWSNIMLFVSFQSNVFSYNNCAM